MTKINFSLSDSKKTNQGKLPEENLQEIRLNNGNFSSGTQFFNAKLALRKYSHRVDGRRSEISRFRYSSRLLPNQDAVKKQPSTNIQGTPVIISNMFGGSSFGTSVSGNDKTPRRKTTLDNFPSYSVEKSGDISNENNPVPSQLLAFENMHPAYQDYKNDEGNVNHFVKYYEQQVAGKTFDDSIQNRRFADDNFDEKYSSTRNSVKNEKDTKKSDTFLKANVDLMTFIQTSKQKLLDERRHVRDNVKSQRRARSNDNAANNKIIHPNVLANEPDYNYEYFNEYDEFPHDQPRHSVNHLKKTSGDIKQIQQPGSPGLVALHLDAYREKRPYPEISLPTDQAKRLLICSDCLAIRGPQPYEPWLRKKTPLADHNYKATEINRPYYKLLPMEVRVTNLGMMEKLPASDDIIQNETHVINTKEQEDPNDQVKNPRMMHKDINADFTVRKYDLQKDMLNRIFPVMQTDFQTQQAQKSESLPSRASSGSRSDNVLSEKLSTFLDGKTKGNRRVYYELKEKPSSYKNVVKPQFYKKMDAYFKKMSRNRDPNRFYDMPMTNHKMQHGMISNSISESSVLYRPIPVKEKSSRNIADSGGRSKRDFDATAQADELPFQRYLQDEGYPARQYNEDVSGHVVEPNVREWTSPYNSRSEILEAPLMFEYNPDGSNLADEPYSLYYPVVYVRGNHRMIQYMPITNSRLQYYDPEILDRSTLETFKGSSQLEPGQLLDSASDGEKQNFPGSEFLQEEDNLNAEESLPQNSANRVSGMTKDKLQTDPVEVNKGSDRNAAVDQSPEKIDAPDVQQPLQKNLMYNTILGTDDYYVENHVVQQKPSFADHVGDFIGQEEELDNPETNHLDSRDVIKDDGQGNVEMAQARSKRSPALRILDSVHLKDVQADNSNVISSPNSSDILEIVQDMYHAYKYLKPVGGFINRRHSRKMPSRRASALCRSPPSLMNSSSWSSYWENESAIWDAHDSPNRYIYPNFRAHQNDGSNDKRIFYRIKFDDSTPRVITALKIRGKSVSKDKHGIGLILIRYKGRVCEEKQLKFKVKYEQINRWSVFDVPIVADELNIYPQVWTGEPIMRLDLFGCTYKGHGNSLNDQEKDTL